MKKKILAGFLAAVMTMGLAAFSAFAEEDRIVIYENDFSGSTIQEALPAFSNDYVNYGGYAAIEGGKPELLNGALTKAKGTGPNGRTLLFDFTKGGTQAGLSEGIVKISYDLAVRGGGLSDSYAQSYTGMNMSNYWEGGRMIYFDATGWDAETAINGWPSTPSHFVDTDIHKYEILFNFEAQKAYLYVDAVLEHTWENLYSNYGTVKNYSIAMNGDMKTFDNLLIEKYLKFPEFSVEVGEAEVGGISLKATAPAKNWSVIEDEIVIKRLFDGKELSAKVVPQSLESAVIMPEGGFENGYNYEIILPETIEGFSGEEFVLTEKVIETKFAKENAAEAIRVKNYDGEILPVESKNPTELQSVVIEFTDDVSAENAMANLKIFDENGQLVPFTVKSEGNIGEAVFDGVLKENSEYTVKLNGLVVDYSVLMNTKEGSACVKSVVLADAEGNEVKSLADLAVGDKVTAKLEIANSTDEETAYLATVTMQNGKLMTGVGFENASVAPASKTVSEFEFTIGDKENLAFTGLMWHQSKTAPIANSMELVLK